MAEVINLRQARKAKMRSDNARSANEQRARHGQTKAEKRSLALDGARLSQALDNAKRDPS